MKKRIFIISIALLLFLLAWKILFSGNSPDLQTAESLPTKPQATEVTEITEQDIAVDIVNEYAYLPLQYEVNAQGYYTHKAVKQAHLKRQKRVRSPYSLIQSFAPQLKIDRFFVEKSAQFINESYQSTTRATQLSTKQAKIRPFPAETELRTDALPFSVPIDEALQDKPQKQANLPSPLASKGSKPKQTSEEQTAPLAQETKKESVTQAKAQDEAKVDRQEALKDEIKEVKEEVKEDETKAETKDGKQDNDNALLNGAANVAAAVGGLVYGGADLVSAATDVAVSTLGNELQRLLNKIATVNVQLNIDKNLAIKNSKLELLFPICDRENDITFLQTTLHQTDERNQGNIGLGYRFLTKEWMLGANAFLDYDFSHGHARAGVGGEYSRDFMRISVNRYIPLTGWKNSPDVLDYQERAAHGWDVRAKFWLPQLPQLGGKLIYEQYYGDEVALVSKKSRAKNPVAVTAGVTYTPFPLLEFSLDYKRSLTDDDDDTLFSVDVNYQLGVPWAQQIDPKTLNKVRSLMHSRYELVERNNNIVLEYRKQTLIIFKMAKTITAYEGNTRSLNVVQYAKYKPLAIALSGTDFITAGGKLDSASYTVTLPSYSTGGTNTYVITGLATDAKKHQEYAYTTVIVKLKAARGEKSTFTPSESKILANNTDTQVLTLTVNDKNGDATDIPLEDIVIAKGGSYSSMVSSPNRTGTGTYEVTVKAGNKVEEVVLTPRVQGDNVTPATVSVTSMEPTHKDADGNVYSTFESSLESIIANDNQKSELKLTAKNEKGLAITGIKNLLSFEISKITRAATSSFTMSEITESAPGVYTADLKIAVPGNYKVIAKYRGKQIGELDVSILAEEQKADGTKSSFEIAPTTLLANNSDKLKVTITLKDALNIGITGQASKLTLGTSSGTESNLVVSTFTDKGDGVYEGTLKVKVGGAGSYTVIPKHDGTKIGSLSKDITASAQTVDGTKSVFDISPTTVLANESDSVKVTITLKDASSIGITGQASKLTLGTSSGTESNLVVSTFTDKGNGVYEGTLKVKVGGAGSYTVIPKYDSKQIGTLSKNITASAQAFDGTKSTFNISPTTVLANNSDELKVTITLKDASSIGITGQASKLTLGASSGKEANLVVSAFTDKGNGVYEGTLKVKVGGAGSYTVIPKYNTNQIGTLSKTITANAQTVSGTNSAFNISPTTVLANNSDELNVTITLKDASSIGITGQASKLSLGTSSGLTSNLVVSTFTDKGDGVYEGTLKVKVGGAGSYTVIPKYNTNQIGTLSKTITANAQAVDGTKSVFDISPTTVLANESDSVKVTITLKDASSIGITGQASKLSLGASSGTESNLVVSTFTDKGDGVYEGTLKVKVGGAGSYTVIPKYNTNQIGTLLKNITASAQAVDGTKSAFDISPTTVLANESDSVKVTITLKDASSIGITGQASKLSLGASSGLTSNLVVSTFTDKGDGVYEGTLKVKVGGAGSYTVIPKYNTNQIGTLSKNITASAQAFDGTKSTFNISPTTVLANNSDELNVTITLKDASSIGITGQASKLSLGTSSGLTSNLVVSTFTDKGDGVYEGTLKVKVGGAGSYTVIPKYNTNQIGTLSKTITANAQAVSGTNSAFNISPTTVLANNSDELNVTITLKDASSIGITGQASKLSLGTSSGLTSNLVVSTFTDKGDGVYEGTLKVKVGGAGSYTVIPKYNTNQIGTLSKTITANAQAVDGTKSVFDISPTTVLANESDSVKVTITLKDASSIGITGQASKLSLGASSGTESNLVVSTFTDKGDGVYEGTLKVKVGGAGSYTVIPKYNTNQIGTLSKNITASAQAVDGTKSVFDISPTTVLANESDSVKVTITLKDASSIGITGQASKLSLGTSSGTESNLVVSTFTDKGDGVYEGTLKVKVGGAGSYTVIPKYNTNQIGTLSKNITASAQAFDGTKSTFNISPTTVLANNSDELKVTITLKDASSIGITGQASKLTLGTSSGTESNLVVSAFTDNGDGVYEGTLKVKVGGAGSYTVIPKYDSKQIGTLSKTITANAQAVSGTNSAFNISPTTVLANNSDELNVTITLKDASSIGITGQASKLSLGTSSGLTSNLVVSTFTDKGDGVYEGTLKVKVGGAGSYTVIPKYNTNQIGTLSKAITANAQAVDGTKSVFDISPTTVLANESDSVKVTITLKDASSIGITGQASKLSLGTSSGTESNLVVSTFTDKGDGVYEGTLKVKVGGAGSYTVIPKYNTNQIGTLSKNITASAQAVDGTKSVFDISPTTVLANESDSVKVTITLKDASSIGITGQASKLSLGTSSGTESNLVVSTFTDKGDGVYEGTLKVKVGGAGSYTVIPKYNTNQIGTLSKNITASAQAFDGTKSTFNISPTTVLANNSDELKVTITLKDASSIGITGQASKLTLGASSGTESNLVVSAFTDNGDGVYEGTLKVKVGGAGSYTVIPKYDSKQIGTLSKTITANAQTVSGTNSAFNISPTTVLANNSDELNVTITLKDASSIGITGQASKLSLGTSSGLTSNLVVSTFTDKGDGVYEGTLKVKVGGAGSYTVIPKYNTNQIGTLSKTITANAQAVDGTKSVFDISPTTVLANESDSVKVTITLKDASSIGITGQASKLSLGTSSGTESNLVASTFTDKGDGVYEGTLKIKVGGAGSYTVIPKYGTSQIGSLSKEVTATKQVPSDLSVLTANKTEVSVNHGISSSIIKIVLKDASGVVIKGSYKSDMNFIFEGSVSKDDALLSGLFGDDPTENGEFSTYFSATTAGEYTIIPTYEGKQIGKKSIKIKAVEQTIDATESAFGISPTSVVANGTDELTVTITLKDKDLYGIPGQASKLTLGTSSGTLSNLVVSAFTDKGAGVYEGTLKVKVGGAGSYTVIPKYDGTKIGSLSKDITANAQSVDGSKSTFDFSPATVVANGVDSVKVTITLKDASAVGITGQKDKLTLGASSGTESNLVVSTFTDKGEGVYEGTLKIKLDGEGSYTVIPKYDTNQIGSLSKGITATVQTIVKDNSSIRVDSASYKLSATIKVTVTLKDANQVGIKGKSSLLTSSAVTVDNATLNGEWTDNSDGTYSASYTADKAGSSLYAKLTLSIDGWSGSLSSATYTITNETNVPVNGAAFSCDDIATLLSNNSSLSFTSTNGVGYIKSLCLPADSSYAGKVVNFTSKAQYNTTITASSTDSSKNTTVLSSRSSSPSLTFTHKLGKVSSTSSIYYWSYPAIEIPSGSYSTIDAASPTSIVANNTQTSTIKVTLKNGIGVLMDNADSNFSFNFATATSNATLTDFNNEGSGVYSTTVKASAVGSYEVQPWYSDGQIGSLSAIVTATAPAYSTSSITVDGNSYIVDDLITVKVSFKDATGSSFSGLSSDDFTVVVNNASPSDANWTELETGVFQRKYKATSDSTGSTKATVSAIFWGTSVKESSEYTVKMPTISGIVANDRSIIGTLKTMYKGAKFYFSLTAGELTDYNWTVNKDWFTVKDGVFTFGIRYNSDVDKTDVIITGTPKASGTSRSTLTYTFTVNKYFYKKSDTTYNWSDSDAQCKSDDASQYSLPTQSDAAIFYHDWGDTSTALTTRGWTSTAIGDSHYHMNYDNGRTEWFMSGDSNKYTLICAKTTK